MQAENSLVDVDTNSATDVIEKVTTMRLDTGHRVCELQPPDSRRWQQGARSRGLQRLRGAESEAR